MGDHRREDFVVRLQREIGIHDGWPVDDLKHAEERILTAVRALRAEQERECEIQRGRAARYEAEYTREHRAHSDLLGMLAEALPAGVELREAIEGLKARVESAEAALAAADPERVDAVWVCSHCGQHVPDRQVTFEERHDGCGGICTVQRIVDPRVADLERVERAAEAIWALCAPVRGNPMPWESVVTGCSTVADAFRARVRAVLAAADGEVKP
jgi:hypothetical protein